MASPSLLKPPRASVVASVLVLVSPPKGVRVLREVFRSLQGGFSGTIVILLHRGDGSERGVADNLNVASSVMVLPGVDGVRLRDGHAYVVWADAGLVLGADGRLTAAYGVQADDALLLGDEGRDPAATMRQAEPLLRSLASRYGSNAYAVALTALSKQESEGFARVRDAGGHTLALDETDRLWADPSGPRVMPQPGDELLSTAALGPRLRALSLATAR